MISSFSGDYEFLSNFYPCQIKDDLNVIYPSVEHAFQANKSLDVVDRVRIAQIVTPRLARKEGRNLKLRRDWDSVKISIMNGFLIQKFSNKELMLKLLATGEEELVEGNWWKDKFWGVCDGEGSNHLGLLLMDIRQSYKDTVTQITYNMRGL